MRNVVAGNWKSNKLRDEALEWMDGMASWLKGNSGVDVMVAVPAPYLAWCTDRKPKGLHVLAQNVSAEGLVLRLPVDQVRRVIVAYEPVWAIGTGVTASADQAQEMHRSIRGWLTEAFGEEVAGGIPLLYGGSCKPGNAAELFSQDDINGGLIGGASLSPADFQGVIEGHPALNH